MTLLSAFTILLSLAGTLAVPTPVEEKRNNDKNITELIAELYDQVNPNARNNILGDGLTFDFLAAQSFGGGGKDGGVILADNTLFPGVVGNGLSWLVGFLGVSLSHLDP